MSKGDSRWCPAVCIKNSAPIPFVVQDLLELFSACTPWVAQVQYVGLERAILFIDSGMRKNDSYRQKG